MAKFEVTVTSRAVEAAKRTDGLPIYPLFLPSHFQGLKKVGSLQSPPGRSSRHLRPLLLLGEGEGFARGANVVWKESTMDWRKEEKRGCHAAAADDG